MRESCLLHGTFPRILHTQWKGNVRNYVCVVGLASVLTFSWLFFFCIGKLIDCKQQEVYTNLQKWFFK